MYVGVKGVTDPFGLILQIQQIILEGGLNNMLSYPNFVRGPSVVGMRPSFDHFEVFGTHR